MKIIRIKTKFFPQGYKAITIGPFVITKPNTVLDPIDIQHESIHWAQEKEMLIIPFFLWYVIEFFIRLIIYRDWNKAYRNISFEQEAYTNQEDSKYIKNRKYYNWIKYF